MKESRRSSSRTSVEPESPPPAEPTSAKSPPSAAHFERMIDLAESELPQTPPPNPGCPRGRGYIRADSLWGALGDDARRDVVCEWLFGNNLPNTQCVRQIEEVFGIRTNAKAVKFFYQQHAFAWKIGQAKSQAEIEKGLLPSNWEARIREALAQRRFEVAYQALSDKQIIAFEKLDLEKRKIDLKASEIFLTERRLILLEKKMQDAQSTLQDSTITAEEQARRIRKILGQE